MTMKRLLIALTAVVFLTAAMPATRYSVPLGGATFNVGGTGATDIDGCGVSPAVPCATRDFMWTQLVRDWDLRGQPITIQVADGTYSDGFFGQGSPPGLTTQLQIAPYTINGRTPGVTLAQTKQIRWIGNCTNLDNVTIRSTAGPAFFPENGAFYSIECFTLDGSAGGFESLIGTSKNSGLGIGKVVIGCAPGQYEIQPGAGGTVIVFDSYEIDRTKCGTGSMSSQSIGVTNTGNTISLSVPGNVSVGMYAHDLQGCIPVGAKVLSISGGYATMSKNATCSNASEAAWFASHLIGPSVTHIGADRWSYMFYESGMLPTAVYPSGPANFTPHIQVTLKAMPSGYWNTVPDYLDVFVGVDGGLLILNAGIGFDTVVWKGAVSAPTYAGKDARVINGGLVANGGTNDDNIIFTP